MTLSNISLYEAMNFSENRVVLIKYLTFNAFILMIIYG